MRRISMKRIALLTILSAVVLMADTTGKWSGSVSGQFRAADGDTSQPLFVVLKQDGAVLTGSIGPDEKTQIPMQNGAVEGDRLKFEVAQGEKGTLHFNLKASTDEIKGDAQFKKNDGEETAFRVELKKVTAK
jgi:hypothetical protein